jgi:hypothetical protein
MRRTGSIEGTVRNSNNTPLEDVNVIIVAGATQQDIAALTGTDGSFGFSNLLPGNYVLKAFGNRVESDRVPIQVMAGKIAVVKIYLEAATTDDDEDEVADEITADSYLDSDGRYCK